MSQNDKTIQQKLAELDGLVAWFDSDDFVLEQALDHYAAAEKLAAEIEHDLSTMKNQITVLKQKFDSAK